MKRVVFFLLIVSTSLFFSNCEDDFDDVIRYGSINDFIWKGMNAYYLWQAEVPDLGDNRFASNQEYNAFLTSFSSPTALFNSLRYTQQMALASDNTDFYDRFSVIFSDYNELEAALSGTVKNNGADIEFRRKSANSNELIGFVRYVLPNSDAASKNLQRGALFYAINGISLTIENYRSLIANDTYTLNFANFDNGNFTPNGNSLTLTKTEYVENPVYYKNVYQIDNKKVGYLVYNGFYSNQEVELNNAFAYFQEQNITHLIVDLRYNSGGSVTTCARLASMITGQFPNEVFAKQIWNNKVMNFYNSANPEALTNRFPTTISNGAAINSLNLNRLYVLTSNATASASELLINGLTPYINVIRIGTTTAGKNVGSITLYDSPTYRKINVNPSHTYAMQPLVLKIANKNNFSNYESGFTASIVYAENLENLGQIGNSNEPLLATALNHITVSGRNSIPQSQNSHEYIGDSKLNSLKFSGLHIDFNL